MRTLPLLLILLTPTLLLWTSAAQSAREIHRERSLYQNIIVRETFSRRCLVFAEKRGDRNQTCIDLRDPKRLVFPYVRMTLGGLLVNPEPKRVLMLGLGGGSIAMTLSELYPDAKLDLVEIDEAVYRLAKEFFRFEETSNMNVVISDARVFVKRAIRQDRRYDFIILDAFGGDYIPEHLMTVEFFEEIKQVLDDDGVFVANTFATSDLYDHESETYKAAFGPFFNFQMPITGNRVVIAREDGLPADDEIERRAAALAERLAQYGVDVARYPEWMSRGQDWDHNKRPLTDQYSPANLLRGDLY